MILNIKEDLQSRLFTHSNYNCLEELLEVLKMFNVYHYADKFSDDELCYVKITAQKVTLDEFKMHELMQQLSKYFYFRIYYLNMGYEDMYLCMVNVE